MKEIIDKAWSAIESEYRRFKEKSSDIVFNDEKYTIFKKTFEEQYNQVMDTFMDKTYTKELDAHKQAAIITISCLKGDIITHKVQDNKISIVPQLIAINVGLSYMNDRLNELLEKKHIKERIDKYILPVAIACNTPYIEIMSRILYYEQQDEYNIKFNILELSDRYFLLEYINLIEYGIEPSILRSTDR